MRDVPVKELVSLYRDQNYRKPLQQQSEVNLGVWEWADLAAAAHSSGYISMDEYRRLAQLQPPHLMDRTDVRIELSNLLSRIHWQDTLMQAASSPILGLRMVTNDHEPHDRHDWPGRPELHIRTIEGTLVLYDDGQCCCEHRYMSTDDDLPYYVGSTLMNIEECSHNVDRDDDYDVCHEQTFVKVTTTLGSFTLVSHNEHNGYYGGISLQLKFAKPPA